jgi:hypothetical protein
MCLHCLFSTGKLKLLLAALKGRIWKARLSFLMQSLRQWHQRGLWFGDVKGCNIVVDDSRRDEGIIAVYLIDLESYVVWSGSAVTVAGIQVRGT